MKSDRVIMGQISGLFGIKGWLKIISYTKPREDILEYSPWLIELDSQWIEQRIVQGRRQGKTIVVQLQGFDDRSQVEDLVGAQIAVLRNQLPAVKKGEYYWADLIGFNVITEDGRALGKLSYLIETGSNDVMVLEGSKKILVPFIKDDVVKTVDLKKGRIIVDWEDDS